MIFVTLNSHDIHTEESNVTSWCRANSGTFILKDFITSDVLANYNYIYHYEYLIIPKILDA